MKWHGYKSFKTERLDHFPFATQRRGKVSENYTKMVFVGSVCPNLLM
jgi:hypothetical protein